MVQQGRDAAAGLRRQLRLVCRSRHAWPLSWPLSCDVGGMSRVKPWPWKMHADATQQAKNEHYALT